MRKPKQLVFERLIMNILYLLQWSRQDIFTPSTTIWYSTTYGKLPHDIMIASNFEFTMILKQLMQGGWRSQKQCTILKGH